MYRAHGRVGLINRDTGSGGLSLPASALFDLDATQAASYGGTGQVWSNLVAAPADGSAKTAYDFNLGGSASVSTDDPTFNGTAGSPSAYWSFDSGDFFRVPANTAFFNNLQKTTGGTPFWVATAFRHVDSGAVQTLWGTSSATTIIGARISISAANLIQFQMRGDTANVTSSSGTFSALVGGTDYVYITSYDGSGNIRQWLNSVTNVGAAFTPNTCVTDTSNLMTLGAGAGTGRFSNGARAYAWAGGNSYIDNAQAADIFAIYNTRHGRTYA